MQFEITCAAHFNIHCQKPSRMLANIMITPIACRSRLQRVNLENNVPPFTEQVGNREKERITAKTCFCLVSESQQRCLLLGINKKIA